jgi:hypothetical protein
MITFLESSIILPRRAWGRKSAFRQCPGRDAALRRPDGAARRPYQKLICVRAWFLAGVLLFLLCRPAPAQPILVSNYPSFLQALNSGTEVINNFVTNTTISLTTSGTSVKIGHSVLIDGGTNGVVFDGNGLARIFTVAPKCVLTLNNLQILNGTSTSGGAVFNEGTLIISNCIISGNSATNLSGAVGATNSDGGNGDSGASGGTAQGGAIYSTGPVSIYFSVLGTNSSIGGNGGSGAAGGDGFLFGSNGGDAGSGGSAFGAAVYSTGSRNIFVSTEFFNNTCTAGSAGSGGSSGGGAFAGSGGQGASGGSAQGGAVFVQGEALITNCVFADNSAKAGDSGADLSGNNNGFNGGLAEGGGLYIAGSTSSAYMENTLFFQNTCTGGAGGSGSGEQATGGLGGSVVGGGVASAVALMTIRYCTVASNTLAVGAGYSSSGTNANGTSGTNANGTAYGWDIGLTAGVVNLSSSILSGGSNAAPNNTPNASGVTDEGQNVSSDASLAQNFASTRINTDPLLDSGLAQLGGPSVGPADVAGPVFLTLDILPGSPAANFIFGVPGLSFPATDQLGNPRGSPTSAGAYELNHLTLDTNAPPPAVFITSQETNALTDDGGTVTFAVSATSNDTNGNALGYQWQLNGKNVPANNHFVGATSPTLTVTGVTAADQGAYQVAVSVSLLENVTYGAGFSLTITNPVKIKTQPASQRDVPIGSVATLRVGVTGSPPFTFQWYMGTNQLTDTSNISGSTSSNLTINPALPSDAGEYHVVVANDYTTRTSAVAALSINPIDKTEPTVSFSSPAAGARTNALAITGKAEDNAQVTNVIYWVTNVNAGRTVTQGAASLSTNGTTTKQWSITQAFLPGTNYVTVQSVDYSGNKSTLAKREFFYQVPAPFSLLVNPPVGKAAGTVTGAVTVKGGPVPFNEAALYIGESYKLTAHPAKNWQLANWMVDTNIAGTDTTLTFIMESNLVVTANFITNSVAPEKTKPSVAITFPKANSRSTAPVLNGTASDHVKVLNVAYWITNLNSGVISSGLAVLSGGTQWAITNALLPGTNILVVQSSNYSGLASAVARTTFFYQVTNPFSLIANPPVGLDWITGVAAIKGNPAPANEGAVYIGEGYKLTAQPPAGWSLVNWMENTNVAGADTTLAFVMKSNLVVTANFALAPVDAGGSLPAAGVK